MSPEKGGGDRLLTVGTSFVVIMPRLKYECYRLESFRSTYSVLGIRFLIGLTFCLKASWAQPLQVPAIEPEGKEPYCASTRHLRHLVHSTARRSSGLKGRRSSKKVHFYTIGNSLYGFRPCSCLERGCLHLNVGNSYGPAGQLQASLFR
jgi:hypothetical protein